MRKLIILSTLFFFGFVSEEEYKDRDAIEIEKAATAFSEVTEILKKENGKLWNCSLLGPIMFVDRKTRVVYANELDLAGEFTKMGTVFVGKLPENMIIANTACDWNGQRWTMVALPLPEVKEDRLNLIIHESFHRIQPKLGFENINEKPNSHLDSKDGRIYLRLELEALKQALKSKKPEIDIKNALLFRQYRHSLFPESKINENSLEINEGIAEYTGSILSQRTELGLNNYYTSRIATVRSSSFVRSFAYLTIPMYGCLMRQQDKKWNQKITVKTNLTDFICDFYKMNASVENSENILATAKLYGFETISKEENERENSAIERNNTYKRLFLHDSVLIIDLENRRIGFDPLQLYPFDTLGTIFPIMRVTDNWGVLDVDSCGVLMNKEWSKITASHPQKITDSLITGNGWRLKLDALWKLEKAGNGYRVMKK